MASLWTWLFSAGVATVLFQIISMVLLAMPMRHFLSKINRPRNIPCSGKLEVLSEGENAKFEIIAVHGLGADPYHTWTTAPKNKPAKDFHPTKSPRVHLLHDLLVPTFPEARVLSFACNSNWLIDAPIKTSEEIGKCLLTEIKDKRPSRRLPIIFIGHSLGGIIIKQALCGDAADAIIEDTSGIIFLGTPHQGSSLSSVATILAFLTRFLGSDTTLLLSLRSHERQLSNLSSAFRSRLSTNRMRKNNIHIISFYETRPLSFGWFSMGLVVSWDSATVHADKDIPIDKDHSGLNKCSGVDDELFVKLAGAIKRLRAPSLLEQADELIRQKHYTAENLNIVPLSGQSLAMEQCYVDLVIVKHSDLHTNVAGDIVTEPDIMATRQTAQFDLQTLFNEHVLENDQIIKPRRILIRGRPGVGKTTLCKKIVHDFEKGLWANWNKLFDRVLWIPLRNLKVQERRKPGYSLRKLFCHEFFSQYDRDDLAGELSREVERNAERTLFLLDGLDEVSQDLRGNSSMSSFLSQLLKQPNVIITSRPCVTSPPDLHLDLENIGFHPEQVINYIRNITGQKAGDIQSFLQKNSLIQGLASIPMQLDALCYAWQEVNSAVPKTMTALYKIIVDKLWRKDVVRLEKVSDGDGSGCLPGEIRYRVEEVSTRLEYLAFSGLHRDKIDFTPDDRDEVVDQFPSLHFLLDKTLNRLSFLRTSDPSSSPEARNYHFLHLTFQDFFAASYFVRQWKAKDMLMVLSLGNGDGKGSIAPVEFLRKYKYSARHDNFWRFVAGLLDDKDGHAQAFINQVEEEPLDILGPTHQRMVMRCLSEICGSLPMRKGLEQRLSQWLLFERRFYESAWLAREAELPEQALETALFNESPDIRTAILDTQTDRAGTSSNMIERATILLSDGDVLVQEAAVKFFGRQSALPEVMLSSVIARLNAKESRVRTAAIEILESQPVLPDKAMKAIHKLCFDSEISTRAAAFKALSKRNAVPDDVLIDTVWDLIEKEVPEQRFRIRAAVHHTLINRHALSNEIFTALLGRLDAQDPILQRDAVYVLLKRSTLPHKVFIAILGRLDDPERGIQCDAIEILGRRDALPQEIFISMIKRLDNKDSHIQCAAIQVLSLRVDWPDETYRAITERLYYKDSYIRCAAIQVLGSRDGLSDKVVTTLVELVDVQSSTDSRTQNAAIEALGNQRSLPDKALTVIAARLIDEKIQKSAADALGMRSNLPNDILEALSAHLYDEDPDMRIRAILALRWQSTLPTEALMSLTDQLLSVDEDIWNRASCALLALSSEVSLPIDVLWALLPLVNHDYGFVQFTAITALGNQDLAGEELQEFVTRVNRVSSKNLRLPIIAALRKQSVLPFSGLELLVGLLDDSDFRVRHAASEAAMRKNEVLCFSCQVHGIAGLYSTLLERSFKERISLCIEKDKLSIHLPDGVLEYPFEDEQPFGDDHLFKVEPLFKSVKRQIQRARRAEMPPISSVEIFSGI